MSITKLSPNWACQMGPVHFINFLVSGIFHSFRYFETVECLENRSNVVVFWDFTNSTDVSILNSLEAVYLFVTSMFRERE